MILYLVNLGTTCQTVGLSLKNKGGKGKAKRRETLAKQKVS